MTTVPPENSSAAGEQDAFWLRQFYSPGKSTHSSEGVDPQPPSGIAIPPAEKYRIGDELGAGGMKSVLRTFERSTERNVAMAVLRDPSASPKKMARFVREARITAALEHPNIVPVYEIGLDAAGKPYFTMKLLGGETLQFILQRVHADFGDYRKRWPLNSLLQVFLDVCNAIGFAHSRGVVHFDLKPANIQVDDFGDVLVIDWGLARVLEKDPALFPNRLILEKSLRGAQYEGVSGTPKFMSPEQARGDNDELDERTDIYALGAILHAILHCRNNPGKTDRRSRKENSKIPAALAAVATKAMSDLPENRYQTVEELAGDVRAYIEGFATEAQHAGAFTQLGLLIKRHRVVASLVAISLVAIFAILTVALIRIRHSEQVAVHALEKFQAEQAGKHELGLIAAPQLIQRANDAKYDLNYDEALALLKQTVILNKNHEEAWWKIAAIHLGRWEFDQAAEAFAHLPKSEITTTDSHPVDMQGMLKKYAAIVPGQTGETLRQTRQNFVHDLIDANRSGWPDRQLALSVFFKRLNSDPQTLDFELIEKALRWLNPEARDFVFSRENTPAGLKVSLHGSKVSEICPLAGLPITILDLSDTGNVGLDYLRDAPLTSIDLSRSQTGEIRQLDKWPTIREIRLVDWADRDFMRLGGFRNLQRVIVAPVDIGAAMEAVKNLPGPPQVIGG